MRVKENKIMIKKFKDLITSVDVLNTLHGGVSEPFLSILEDDIGRELRVRVPGIDRDALQVEIVNSSLSVFYLLPIISDGKLVYLPQVVYNQEIPYFVAANEITAGFENNELVIQLPFNKHSNGLNRTINIDNK
jgi:HSP20 family molecular chaperone IbpA